MVDAEYSLRVRVVLLHLVCMSLLLSATAIAGGGVTNRPFTLVLDDSLYDFDSVRIGAYRLEKRIDPNEDPYLGSYDFVTAVLKRKGRVIAHIPKESVPSLLLRYGTVRIIGGRSQQLLLESSSGGAHGELGFWVFDLGSGGRLIFDKSWYEESEWHITFEDLDHDGTYEILLPLDCPFLKGISHAGQRRVECVVSYNTGLHRFRAANHRFRKFLRSRLDQLLLTTNADDPDIGDVVEVACRYMLLGEKKAALKYFEDHYTGSDKALIREELSGWLKECHVE